jgi:predicted nucleotidyltransferase
MEKFYFKTGYRLKRGKTNSFEELPEFAKENFKIIKEEVLNFIKKETKLYIFGSFLWGHWSEESDYDVVICEKIDLTELVNKIRIERQIKVDFFISDKIDNLPQIP